MSNAESVKIDGPIVLVSRIPGAVNMNGSCWKLAQSADLRAGWNSPICGMQGFDQVLMNHYYSVRPLPAVPPPNLLSNHGQSTIPRKLNHLTCAGAIIAKSLSRWMFRV